MRERGIEFLVIEIEDTVMAACMSFHHRDPFDRMIIAQGLRRDLQVVTRDRLFQTYGVPVIWA